MNREYCLVCKNTYSNKKKVFCQLTECNKFACPYCMSCCLDHYIQFGSFPELKSLRLKQYDKLFCKKCHPYYCCPHIGRMQYKENLELDKLAKSVLWNDVKQYSAFYILNENEDPFGVISELLLKKKK